MAFSKVLLAIAVLLAVLSLAASQGFGFGGLGGGYNSGFGPYGGYGFNGFGGGYQGPFGYGYNSFQQYPRPGGFSGGFNLGPGGYGRR